MKSVSLQPFTSQSHNSGFRLCIHTLVCNEVTELVAPQRATTAKYILLLIIFLLPIIYHHNILFFYSLHVPLYVSTQNAAYDAVLFIRHTGVKF